MVASSVAVSATASQSAAAVAASSASPACSIAASRMPGSLAPTLLTWYMPSASRLPSSPSSTAPKAPSTPAPASCRSSPVGAAASSCCTSASMALTCCRSTPASASSVYALSGQLSASHTASATACCSIRQAAAVACRKASSPPSPDGASGASRLAMTPFAMRGQRLRPRWAHMSGLPPATWVATNSSTCSSAAHTSTIACQEAQGGSAAP
mmetsp:Transcript_34655/g.87392  ORF Transcript_34655/g.87392 Transcript_34655/m.87392 type:complete len:211 (+) Transcript_34655:1270-1902(+)